MTEMNFREIGELLATAFRLTTRPLAVYGSETLPSGTVHVPEVNRCLAASLYKMAAEEELSAIYVTGDSREGCCPGGLTHTGFLPGNEFTKYFVSTGTKDFREGAAEYLKSSPEIFERCQAALGKITPPGKYLIIQACETLPDRMPEVRSICCFGAAEQIRNLAALVHFDRDDPFSPVIVPWGPSCSTFISYPAGMCEKAPKNTAFMGPADPTQNRNIPPEMMALGIPAEMAVRMVGNLGLSFISRRPQVAFPNHERG
ncbi:MAG: DUF169 domain-containing protein [Thermoplasmata archaeon]|nr:DUF169 domain-containing protein [Thermoplasmata archaeon]